MTVVSCSIRHALDNPNGPAKINRHTTYIRALHREDAQDLCGLLNQARFDIVRDGGYEYTRVFEVVGMTRAANDKIVYISEQDMENIASEYTKPLNGNH